jgi:hypothetical protein
VVEVSFTRHTTIPRDQGRRANSACADCELLVYELLTSTSAPPTDSDRSKVRLQGRCKPQGAEPGYLQTNQHQDTQTREKHFVCQSSPSRGTSLSSRLRETHDPIGGETFTPRHHTNIVRLPQPKGKKLSVCQERAGRTLPC